MKSEISAGGVVVLRTGNIWKVLVLRDMNDVRTFPKGLIESGEAPEAAARREIQEEVGLSSLTLVKKLPSIQYMYERRGLVSKTVHYFLFTCDGTETLTPQKEEGIHDAKFIDLNEALKTIGYAKTNLPLLQKVKLWTSNPHRT